MKIKTLFTTLVVLSISFQSLFSQHTTLTGQISDAVNHTPIEYANIALLKQDSTFVSGVISNEQGRYRIGNIPQGSYLLSASFMGYDTSYLQINISDSDKETDILLQPSSIALREVTIAAKSIINKGDRQLVLPSQMQVRTSADGLDLLRKLQLSRIMVDPISNEVTISGNGEVQLRINGVHVTSAEVAALKPEDIIRIEYHDNPGARYGNAAAVIDYIMRRYESGGSIRGSMMHNLNSGRTSADDLLAIKYNHKKSEFSANASYQQRKGDWIREYDEKFVYPDHELHRLEIGEPTAFNKKALNSTLNYSLLEKDKYFFNAQLRYTYLDFPAGYEDRKSQLYISDSDNPISIYDHTTEKSNSPALDLYFQRNLKNNQSLIFNIVGTYIDTKNIRIYQEKMNDVNETDIYSKISGNKYSLIAEGIYERKIGNSKLTGGLKHMQSYTDNEYNGTVAADISMVQAESNAYAEYQIKYGKWGYMANLTATRFYYSQDGKNSEEYGLQPSARITYTPNNDLFFRYSINLRNNTPSLAYLNDVEQTIDPLQVRKGNPLLNSFRSLMQSFNATYNKEIWSIDLMVNYDYQYKPIMESVKYEDGVFVRTYQNQKAFQELTAEATFRLKPWKDHLSISVSPRINRYISEGNDYLHTYTMKELRVNIDFSYDKFIAAFTTITPPNRGVYSEQLSEGQLMHTIMAGYKKPQWSVMLGVFNPFTKTYKANNENWAALNPVKSEIHTKNMSQMIFIKCGFNLNFGKQVRSGSKLINNSDNDSGIMSGTKG